MTTTTVETLEAVIPSGGVFSVDVAKRTITGRVVPFGEEGRKGGRRFMFGAGTVRGRGPGIMPKLWVRHDPDTALGVAVEFEDREDGDQGPGVYAAFKVATGPEGDKALHYAAEGIWDGLSLGPTDEAKFQLRNGVYHAVDVPIHEVSLTPAPVFTGARVHAVKFDTTTEESTMPETDTTTPPEAASGFSDEAATALGDAISGAISDGFASLLNPQEDGPDGGPLVVRAGSGAHVEEPSPYRFDGIAGEHCFTQDIRDGYLGHDGEARQRVEEFIEEVFAVTTTNVGTLNPTQNRPDLYVPNLTFTTPLWDLVSKGNITDKTAFTVPKFSSASGLVGDHTEGVEPTPGAFAATSQPVNPAPMSGKIEINREVWDQGGSPQADGIIWGEMLNAWSEAREAKIAARLATTATAELNLGSVVDSALVAAITNYLAGLQFVRGGNRFTAFASDGKMFPALVAAKDGQNRPLLPILGPTNAQGTVDGGFDRVQVGNAVIRAAWALAQGANTRSYNFVPSSVWCWASPPKRFTFEYQVKSIDMAIWGYCATAILRDSDVKPIDYDVADA